MDVACSFVDIVQNIILLLIHLNGRSNSVKCAERKQASEISLACCLIFHTIVSLKRLQNVGISLSINSKHSVLRRVIYCWLLRAGRTERISVVVEGNLWSYSWRYKTLILHSDYSCESEDFKDMNKIVRKIYFRAFESFWPLCVNQNNLIQLKQKTFQFSNFC